QRLYSIASPANAVRATNVSANHTMKKPRSQRPRWRTRSRKRAITSGTQLRRGGLQPEHRVVGEVEVGPEQLGQELVVQLDVDTHRVPVRRVARVLRRVRPTPTPGVRGVEGTAPGEPRVLDAVRRARG